MFYCYLSSKQLGDRRNRDRSGRVRSVFICYSGPPHLTPGLVTCVA